MPTFHAGADSTCRGGVAPGCQAVVKCAVRPPIEGQNLQRRRAEPRFLNDDRAGRWGGRFRMALRCPRTPAERPASLSNWSAAGQFAQLGEPTGVAPAPLMKRVSPSARHGGGDPSGDPGAWSRQPAGALAWWTDILTCGRGLMAGRSGASGRVRHPKHSSTSRRLRDKKLMPPSPVP